MDMDMDMDMKYNCDLIEELYPEHSFSHTLDDDGYGEIELIIDEKYTGIWLYEYMFYGADPKDLKYIREEIDWYLSLSGRMTENCRIEVEGNNK